MAVFLITAFQRCFLEPCFTTSELTSSPLAVIVTWGIGFAKKRHSKDFFSATNTVWFGKFNFFLKTASKSGRLIKGIASYTQTLKYSLPRTVTSGDLITFPESCTLASQKYVLPPSFSFSCSMS